MAESDLPSPTLAADLGDVIAASRGLDLPALELQ